MQGELDDYCRNIVQKEHRDCEGRIFARFGKGKNGGRNQWRCYKSVKKGKMAKSCIDDQGEMKECQEPDPAGGKYCTRDSQIREIIDSDTSTSPTATVEEDQSGTG